MIEFLNGTARPSTRVSRGNLVLANAQGLDTAPVKARLDAFSEIHRRYIDAQANVEKAVALERQEARHVAQLDGAEDLALTDLSIELQRQGGSRRNPFSRYAALGPGKMSQLSFAAKPAAIRQLVATLRRSIGVASSVMKAAAAAEQAAAAVEIALTGWNLRRSYLAMARQSRDSLGPQWDAAYTSLRLLTGSLLELPMLRVTLFPKQHRNAKESRDTSPAELPAPNLEPHSIACPESPAADSVPSRSARVIAFRNTRLRNGAPPIATAANHHDGIE